MAKDPAVLFYTSDFLTGTTFMDYTQRGKYITLLCLQHQHGHLTETQIKAITTDEIIIEKFIKAEDGKFHNLRLHEEILKRKAFCESRRKSRLIGVNKQRTLNVRQRHVERTENENENENRIKNKIEIPNFIKPELWQQFLDMRKSIKKPMSENAQKLAFKKLEKIKIEGYDIEEVVTDSIINGHQGFYPKKKQGDFINTKENTYPQYKEL